MTTLVSALETENPDWDQRVPGMKRPLWLVVEEEQGERNTFGSN